MNFARALEALLENKHIQRNGWGSSVLFLFKYRANDLLPEGWEIIDRDPSLEKVYTIIKGRLKSGEIVHWGPSQDDILADDWIIK